MQIVEKLLTPNKYSRPCTKREKTTKIAIHYIGNPNTSAIANRNYFDNLRFQNPVNDKTNRWVSSHYIVGLQGEVIRCIPDDEISYCTNQANVYSISIETCHPKSDGIFTDTAYISLCELCALLLKKYNLTTNDLIRHYDITKKQCPLHWSPTKYQSETIATARWNKFKSDVQVVMNGGKVTKNNTVYMTTSTDTSNSSFKVRIICDELNVRKNAGTHNPIVTVVHKNEVYTIVDTKYVGIVKWGKLKSGAGWISLGEKYVKAVL